MNKAYLFHLRDTYRNSKREKPAIRQHDRIKLSQTGNQPSHHLFNLKQRFNLELNLLVSPGWTMIHSKQNDPTLQTDSITTEEMVNRFEDDLDVRYMNHLYVSRKQDAPCTLR